MVIAVVKPKRKWRAPILPKRAWPIWLLTGGVGLGLPATCFVYYPMLLLSGQLDHNSDSTGIPLALSLVTTAIITPPLVLITAVCLWRYPGQVSLAVWNARRPVVSALLSALFLLPSAVLLVGIVDTVVTPTPTYFLEMLWLPWTFACLLWCLALRGAAVAPRGK